MANRSFSTAWAKEKMLVTLGADVTFGASGAPTLVVAKSKAVKSISRIKAGFFLITLADQYQHLLGAGVTFISGGSAAAAPDMQLVQNGVAVKHMGVAVLATVVATNVITINGVTFTCVASGATGNQFNVGGSDTLSATAAAAAINASTTAGIAGVVTAKSYGTLLVISSSLNGTVAWSATNTFTLTPSAALAGPSMLAQLSLNGTAADPASGEEGRFFFHVNNSSAL